ncbi:olfactory receptor 5P80-like [Clarias gariepinus]
MVGLITQLSFCKSNEINSFFCDHAPIHTIACMLLALIKITTWDGRLKAFKTCVSHLLVVAIFFIPTSITNLADAIYALSSNARIINISLSVAIPPMLNPIIYVLNTKEFRRFIIKIRSHT